MTDYLI